MKNFMPKKKTTLWEKAKRKIMTNSTSEDTAAHSPDISLSVIRNCDDAAYIEARRRELRLDAGVTCDTITFDE